MAWSSAVYIVTLEDILENTTAIDLVGDTFNVALFGDGTPDKTVASAATAFGSTMWGTTLTEKFDGAEWATGGQALDSVTLASAAGVMTFDAANEVSAGTSATLSAVFGCLIYNVTVNTPVDSQGISFHSFGGTQSVTDGTFTVNFHGSGIFTITA
jgi:hypothetical protein